MKPLKQMFEESCCSEAQVESIVQMLADETKAQSDAADEFDRMTAAGWKLNLLTGEYYK